MNNIQNYTLLDPIPGDPSGYVTKDETWAAVPFGKNFVIIHNGKQVYTVNSIAEAKAYIQKHHKKQKTKSKASLESFM